MSAKRLRLQSIEIETISWPIAAFATVEKEEIEIRERKAAKTSGVYSFKSLKTRIASNISISIRFSRTRGHI